MYGDYHKACEWIRNKVGRQRNGCVLGIAEEWILQWQHRYAAKPYRQCFGDLHALLQFAQDTADARLIAEKLDICYIEINLEKAYDCIIEMLPI